MLNTILKSSLHLGTFFSFIINGKTVEVNRQKAGNNESIPDSLVYKVKKESIVKRNRESILSLRELFKYKS
jgi:hypothetical protein